MKKLLLITAIALLFISCSNDEEFKILKGKEVKESIISIDTTKL